MTGIINQFVSALIVGAIGAAAICGGGPFYRQKMAEKRFNEARKALDDSDPRQALQALHAVENWSQRYPNIGPEITTEMIRAYAQDDQYSQALKKAEWLRTTPELGDTGIAANSPLHAIPDQLYNKLNPPLSRRSKWSGYRTLAEALSDQGDKENLGKLYNAVAGIDPDHELLNTIRKHSRKPTRRTRTPETPVASTSPDQKTVPTPVQSVDTGSIDDGSKHWAATVKETGAYNSDGKLLRKLKPGVFGEVIRMANLKGKEMVLANLHYKGKLVKGVYLVPHNLIIQKGDLTDMSEDARKKHMRSIELARMIEQRKQEIAAAKSDTPTAKPTPGGNPHLAAYESKKKDVLAFNKRGESLMKKFEAAQGTQRMKISDELRGMKNQQTLLMNEFNALKEKKQAWDRKNSSKAAPAPTPVAQGPDPKLRAMEDELILLQTELRQN